MAGKVSIPIPKTKQRVIPVNTSLTGTLADHSATLHPLAVHSELLPN